VTAGSCRGLQRWTPRRGLQAWQGDRSTLCTREPRRYLEQKSILGNHSSGVMGSLTGQRVHCALCVVVVVVVEVEEVVVVVAVAVACLWW
jgi:hypothetical protein